MFLYSVTVFTTQSLLLIRGVRGHPPTSGACMGFKVMDILIKRHVLKNDCILEDFTSIKK